MVPSLVPTIVKWKNMRDRAIEIITQSTSNIIFMFPNSLLNVSEIVFTNASPEFIITFAITEREMPKARMTIPTTTMTIRTR